KAKVTQDAVTDACDELMESGKNVTVNAITAMTGGSFSTVGAMITGFKRTSESDSSGCCSPASPATKNRVGPGTNGSPTICQPVGRVPGKSVAANASNAHCPA
ncbi:MAG: DNA-binding protein, partial [Nitrosomonas sp.]|nr:DNA-binding protein [Nitrosomonas sp.]MBP6077126.1 DNA-binding protein [Nitrosomonas sp.]MBP9871930.1 DNA-binding protein [Nitrosomonas sp.]